jgi:cytochrome c-type biogenesis protein CcmH/NrfG
MNTFDHDIISRYLEGAMDAQELRAFETQLEQDIELQRQVELHKEVNESLKTQFYPDENEQALRNTMQELRGEYFYPKANVVSMKRFRWLGVAAAAIIILFITSRIWYTNKIDLYEQYAYVQMPGTAERGATSDTLLQQATEDFNNKNYSAAIPLFQTLLQKDPQNSFVHYYYTIALLENGQIDQSRVGLAQLYEGNSLFKYDAAFYMGLSYLKENDKKTCKEWLEKIPKDADVYGKAKELEAKL